MGKADSLYIELLTSSEVELMETLPYLATGRGKIPLLTSSEVELMETFNPLVIKQENFFF